MWLQFYMKYRGESFLNFSRILKKDQANRTDGQSNKSTEEQ